jgi:hypothetical protein
MNGVDDPLDRSLAAWREDSLQAMSPHRRERARAAMLAAVAGAAGPDHHPGALLRIRDGFRLRSGPLRLAGALAALAAAVTVALIGWNAPAGSPLHGLRVARQGLLLAMPGANLAELHLQFAEQSLADAHNEINPAASLADAGAELDAARGELPVDHSSALWTRWGADEAMLGSEDAELRTDQGPPGDAAEARPPVLIPSASGTPRRPTGKPSASASGRASQEPSESPEPSASPSPGGGDDGDGSPSPSASPHDG